MMMMMNSERSNILRRIDWLSVVLYLLLVIFGWVNILSSVWNSETNMLLSPGSSQVKQLIWIAVSIGLIFIIFLIDTKIYSFFSYPLYIFGLLSLMAVLVFGEEINGAKSWLDLGFFKFQPAEFAKVFTALALARLITSHNFSLTKLKHFIIAIGIILFPMLLIMIQPDTGSALVFTAFILVLYREGMNGVILFVGFLLITLFVLSLLVPSYWIIIALFVLSLIFLWLNERNLKLLIFAFFIPLAIGGLIFLVGEIFSFSIQLKYVFSIALGLGILTFIPANVIFKRKNALILSFIVFTSLLYLNSVDYVYSNVLEQHQRDRIEITLGIKEDPQGIGYNVNQSKIAIGSGGFYGKGFLNGTQTKFDFVPEQSTDFIFCTVGEEFGFLGSTIVLVLFISLILRIVYISERQRTRFARVYGYAVASIIFIHVAINIGMTVGIMPVIGIPLPFFSYGGSSLMAFTVLLFILLRFDASRMQLFR